MLNVLKVHYNFVTHRTEKGGIQKRMALHHFL